MPKPKPNGRALLLVLLLWGAGLGAAAQFAKMAVVLPELSLLYPGRGAAIGFLFSLISLLGVVLGLVAGWFSARVGLRRLLLAALVLGALTSLAQALLPPFPVMLASRVIEGLSHLGIVVTAPTLIGTLAPGPSRGAAMTLWGTFFGVAFAVTAWLGVPFAQDAGVDALFLAHATYMAAMAALLWRLLPVDAAVASQAEPLDLGAVMRRHRAAYTSPRISAPALGWVFYTATFVALVTVLPARLPEEARTFVASAMPIASIVVSMTLGIALLRVASAVQVVALGFVVAIPLSLGFLIWPDSVWLPVILVGALGLIQGASFAAIPQLNESTADQALANGAVAQMGNTGNLLGTPVLLAVVGWLGLPGMVGLLVAAYACGLAAHAVTARARAR
ncbi:MAG: MFS transporter [Pseudomonadota bacterium]